jgi:glycosyltransferase involved in cell wall biosynthesis
MRTTSIWKAHAPRRLSIPAAVSQVELTETHQQLAIGAGYRAARLLIRVHGRPVGYADLSVVPGQTVSLAEVLAALDAPTVERAVAHLVDDLTAAGIAVLDSRPELPKLLDLAVEASVACQLAGSAAGPLVTVAICTRDRWQTLGDTLASLSRQTYRNFEILVVDNAPSSDATEQLLRSSFPHVRYIREPRRGLDNARNRAIAEACGAIVAYVDDDAIADAQWVRAIVAAFDAPEVMCVTGLVAPAQLDTPGQELFERYGYSKGFYRLAFRLAAPPPDCAGFPYKGYLGTGCNSAFRRAVFEHVGLFDPCLDMGTPVPGGGDHDMFARIIRAGYTLAYDPGAVVFHSHLAELDTVVARLGEYQESFMAFMAKSILSDRQYALSLLAHVAFWYVRRTARGFAAVLTKRDRPFALVVSEAIGAWRGPLALYRSYRLAARKGASIGDGLISAIALPAEPVNTKDLA